MSPPYAPHVSKVANHLCLRILKSSQLVKQLIHWYRFAKDHQPCIIFMDEIDAIGGRRFSEGTSADREIQRTLMELLNQLDGDLSTWRPAATRAAPHAASLERLVWCLWRQGSTHWER